MLSDKGFDDINNTVVSKIERGERMVRLAEAVGFADVFGVSLDYLLGRNPAPKVRQRQVGEGNPVVEFGCRKVIHQVIFRCSVAEVAKCPPAASATAAVAGG